MDELRAPSADVRAHRGPQALVLGVLAGAIGLASIFAAYAFGVYTPYERARFTVWLIFVVVGAAYFCAIKSLLLCRGAPGAWWVATLLLAAPGVAVATLTGLVGVINVLDLLFGVGYEGNPDQQPWIGLNKPEGAL